MKPFRGILNVHKRAGVTSRDVVNVVQRRMRELTGERVKCGHAGTLDPLATGVLIICVGPSTRLVSILQEKSKTYRGGFSLGVSSDTDDVLGQTTVRTVDHPPSLRELELALGRLTGAIMQVPPVWSALKVSGRRAYALARDGEVPELKARPVQIHEIRLERYDFPLVELTIRCGSGTYIRSIARDLGEMLGCGGLMHSLVRTCIGCFDIESAVDVETIENRLVEHLHPELAAFENEWVVVATDEQLERLRVGKPLEIGTDRGSRIVVTSRDGDLLAVLEALSDPPGAYRTVINRVPSLASPKRRWVRGITD